MADSANYVDYKLLSLVNILGHYYADGFRTLWIWQLVATDVSTSQCSTWQLVYNIAVQHVATGVPTSQCSIWQGVSQHRSPACGNCGTTSQCSTWQLVAQHRSAARGNWWPNIALHACLKQLVQKYDCS